MITRRGLRIYQRILIVTHRRFAIRKIRCLNRRNQVFSLIIQLSRVCWLCVSISPHAFIQQFIRGIKWHNGVMWSSAKISDFRLHRSLCNMRLCVNIGVKTRKTRCAKRILTFVNDSRRYHWYMKKNFKRRFKNSKRFNQTAYDSSDSRIRGRFPRRCMYAVEFGRFSSAMTKDFISLFDRSAPSFKVRLRLMTAGDETYFYRQLCRRGKLRLSCKYRSLARINASASALH
jgi:hypothetical protein